jgi:hypothetical protein
MIFKFNIHLGGFILAWLIELLFVSDLIQSFMVLAVDLNVFASQTFGARPIF